jgi:uncharacterized protein
MKLSKSMMPQMLNLALALVVSLSASACVIDRVGGAFSKPPEELAQGAGSTARNLIEQALKGIDPARRVDYHTHMIATGTSVEGAFINPRMLKGANLQRLKFQIFASASGVKDIGNIDREYLARLVRLVRTTKGHGKYHILAFDKYYNADGSVSRQKTNIYVPNHYVFELARTHPDIFVPVVSVHPYRPDALQELEKWARQGVKYVKWLPNAMGMDPADPAVEPFYLKMKEHNMILLSHAGKEQAVHVADDQWLGNPLRLRKPLDLGLRVIVAHAASLGSCEDLDRREAKPTECFDLFMRLMDEPKYRRLLFGEISAMPQINRMPAPLATLLKRQDLHPRLVNGSDYPLPAINSLIWTRALARGGFITAEEREAINEIYDYNPLLFDFVLKRTLRHPETRQKLSPAIFMANPGLEN